MRYHKLGNEIDLHIVIYLDAAHGNLLNGGSQGSYVIFLCIFHVSTGEQSANVLTKKGASQKELLKVFQSGFIQS